MDIHLLPQLEEQSQQDIWPTPQQMADDLIGQEYVPLGVDVDGQLFHQSSRSQSADEFFILSTNPVSIPSRHCTTSEQPGCCPNDRLSMLLPCRED